MAVTYNPIISREPISFWDSFGPRMAPEPGQALVLVGHNSPLQVLSFGDRLTTRQAMYGAFHHMYRIDVSEHTLTLDCQLPCASDGLDFHAEAWFTCWVEEPEVIVRSMITDARQVLEPLLIRIMRLISRNYSMKDCAKAERAISYEVLQKLSKQGSFKIKHFVVNLQMEEEELTHIRQMRHLERATELTLKEIEWKRHYNELITELDQRNIDFYKKLIETDHGQLLLLELARHPQDVRSVLDSLNQHLQSDRDYWLKALNALREVDGLEVFDLEKAREYILQHFAGVDQKIRGPGIGNGAPVQVPQPEPQTRTAGESVAGETQVAETIPAGKARAVGETEPGQARAVGEAVTSETRAVETIVAGRARAVGETVAGEAAGGRG